MSLPLESGTLELDLDDLECRPDLSFPLLQDDVNSLLNTTRSVLYSSERVGKVATSRHDCY
jgi:hypothetical protein